MNIQHSSRTDEWYTPADILERVRKVLGTIHLDPASCAEANGEVRALHYFDRSADGLSRPWGAQSVFLNPPGGTSSGKSISAKWWVKLMKELVAKRVGHAIFLAFSLESLQTTQRKGVPALGEFLMCVPSQRVRFNSLMAGKMVPGKAPSHSNVIAYVPGALDYSQKFIEAFEDKGTILNRYNLVP